MYFDIKNYLKNTHNHTAKHAINLLKMYPIAHPSMRPRPGQRILKPQKGTIKPPVPSKSPQTENGGGTGHRTWVRQPDSEGMRRYDSTESPE